jgi:hypothetical protein
VYPAKRGTVQGDAQGASYLKLESSEKRLHALSIAQISKKNDYTPACR